MKPSSLMLAAAIAMLTTTGHAQPSAGSAHEHSANYIIATCRNFVLKNYSSRPFLQGVCVGTVDTLRNTVPGACVPITVTAGQAVRVVVKYIDARPERQHESFRKLAVEAIREAWPCG
jgi:hypothetical protein